MKRHCSRGTQMSRHCYEMNRFNLYTFVTVDPFTEAVMESSISEEDSTIFSLMARQLTLSNFCREK